MTRHHHASLSGLSRPGLQANQPTSNIQPGRNAWSSLKSRFPGAARRFQSTPNTWRGDSEAILRTEVSWACAVYPLVHAPSSMSGEGRCLVIEGFCGSYRHAENFLQTSRIEANRHDAVHTNAIEMYHRDRIEGVPSEGCASGNPFQAEIAF